MNKKICFVGLDAYPVLNPKANNEYFGGESVQHTLLAKAFRDIGYEVSLVSLDYGQKQVECIEGITVYKTYIEGSGMPVLRFIYPKLTSIWSALKKADADIYFQSCAGMLTGVVARFCKKNNRKFIFRLAHDNDCIPSDLIVSNWRDKQLYQYGLRRADLVSAQGVRQVDLLLKNYGLASEPINMTVQVPDQTKQLGKDIDILWVNNIRQFKRPELLIELARLLPQYKITMIGGPVPGNEEMYKSIKQSAMQLQNIQFMGAIPYHEVNSYFDRTRLFVNTSDVEGFPNSFLQAWIRGVPVVSFFDPDGLIARESLGVVPTDIESMAKLISSLLSDSEYLSRSSNNSKTYAKSNYSPDVVARRYDEAIRQRCDVLVEGQFFGVDRDAK